MDSKHSSGRVKDNRLDGRCTRKNQQYLQCVGRINAGISQKVPADGSQTKVSCIFTSAAGSTRHREFQAQVLRNLSSARYCRVDHWSDEHKWNVRFATAEVWDKQTGTWSRGHRPQIVPSMDDFGHNDHIWLKGMLITPPFNPYK